MGVQTTEEMTPREKGLGSRSDEEGGDSGMAGDLEGAWELGTAMCNNYLAWLVTRSHSTLSTCIVCLLVGMIEAEVLPKATVIVRVARCT
jgi:hypothetical protein